MQNPDPEHLEQGDSRAVEPLATRLVYKPITVTSVELDWARARPLALFDRMLLDRLDAARLAGQDPRPPPGLCAPTPQRAAGIDWGYQDRGRWAR